MRQHGPNAGYLLTGTPNRKPRELLREAILPPSIVCSQNPKWVCHQSTSAQGAQTFAHHTLLCMVAATMRHARRRTPHANHPKHETPGIFTHTPLPMDQYASPESTVPRLPPITPSVISVVDIKKCRLLGREARLDVDIEGYGIN